MITKHDLELAEEALGVPQPSTLNHQPISPAPRNGPGRHAAEVEASDTVGAPQCPSAGVGIQLTKTDPTTDAESGDNQRDAAPVRQTSLAAPSPAASIFVEVCATCWAVKDGDDWRPMTEAEQDRIWLDSRIKLTHSCCTSCQPDFRTQARHLRISQIKKQLA